MMHSKPKNEITTVLAMPTFSPTGSSTRRAAARLWTVTILMLAGFGLTDCLAAQHAGHEGTRSQAGPDHFEKTVRPFIENYCADCHSEDGEGGLDLSRFETQSDAVSELELWSEVLKAVEQKEMPPSDASQPDAESRSRVQEAIVNLIAASGRKLPALGRLRRLNRVEYENTIRDLFRLSRDCFNNSSRIVQTTDYFNPASGRMPRSVFAVSYFFNAHRRHSDLPGVSSLPVDPRVEHGFANDQDSLSLSPLQLQNYFELATSVLNNREFAQISGLWESMFAADDSLSKSEQVLRAHRQIRVFLPRAFRQDLSEEDLKVYFDLFDSEFQSAGSYTSAMKTTVAAMLVSPKFLFRREFMPIDPATLSVSEVDRRRSYAMASRLSYFLWGSMPDDQLFQAAKEGRLSRDFDLVAQVKRMMNDVRVKSLATGFGMQWLKLSKVASALPDKTVFPKYYKDRPMLPPPAVSMMIEQLLFFETVMVEDLSIMEFIKSDFGYLNRQLMDWYGVDIEKSVGYSAPLDKFEDFYRVKWQDANRGGVLSAGATLVANSTTTRTSPVYRGAWVLDVIFNSPPPPAPADVPPLEPEGDGKAVEKLNVREKLEKHRLDPACATCHSRIDPLGFALESFDAVGRWRENYEAGDQVDASGDLDGSEFDGPAQFKEVIARENSRYVKAFVEHTIKYALGRQLHYSDDAEVRRVVAAVSEEELRFRSVIKQVVLSKMFRQFDETSSTSDVAAEPPSATVKDSSETGSREAAVETDSSPTVEDQ